MDPHVDTATGRLFSFMEYTWNISDSTPLREPWSRYVSEAGAPAERVFAGLIELCRLPEEAETEISKLAISPAMREMYLAPVEKSRHVLTSIMHLDSPSQSIKARYDLRDLGALEICSVAVSEALSFPAPTSDTLVDIKTRAAEIIDLLTADSSLDSEFASYVLAMMHKVQEGVDIYRIAGSGPLRAEFEHFLGRVVADPAGAKAFSKTKSAEKLLALVGILSAVWIPVFHDAAQIAQDEVTVEQSSITIVNNLLSEAGFLQKSIEPPKSK